MCWVMPPASPAATSVSRIASSSEVLPWSTWPMIVTTGGRSSRLSSESSNSGASGSSSAAVTISILRSYSSAIAFTESSVRVWVRVAISPIIISFLITSALPRPSSSATSRTVAPGLDLGRLRLDRLLGFGRRLLEQRPAAAPSAAARRALRRRAAHLVAARGLRVDHDAAFFRRRPASGFRFRRWLCGRVSSRAAGFASARLAFGAALAAAFGRGFLGRRRRRRRPWRRRSPSARRPPRRSRRRLSPRPRRLSAPRAALCCSALGLGDLVNALLCH